MIGKWLRGVRAGDAHLLARKLPLGLAPLTLRSAWFEPGAPMPAQTMSARHGPNRSPPLDWSGVPAAAVELALVMQDPDVPFFRPLVHLVATRLAPTLGGLAEGALNPPSAVALLGRDSFGRAGYNGPGPIPGHGPHRYVFALLALARPLPEPRGDGHVYADVLAAVRRGDGLAAGSLEGTYER